MNNHTPPQLAAKITVFKSHRGILSKQIALGPDGAPKSDGSACAMSSGTAVRTHIVDAVDLEKLLNNMQSAEALAIGRTVDTEPAKVSIITAAAAAGMVPGSMRGTTITRSKENFTFHREPGFGLLDFDLKFMPSAVSDAVKARGGFFSALLHVAPGLGDAAKVTRSSTSSGLIRTDTGEQFPGSGGQHVYIHVSNMIDWPRGLRNLHDRLWLEGMGFFGISKSGALLERSLVDISVASPERLIFEGPPVLAEPLVQDRDARAAVPTAGIAVDTHVVLPDLSAREREELNDIKKRRRDAMLPEAQQVKAKYIANRAQEIVTRDKVPLSTAMEMASAQANHTLLPHVELVFDDSSLGTVPVRDLLLDPDRFAGETLADPNDGPDHGRAKAMVKRRGSSGELYIDSFRHGGIEYTLRHTAETVRESVANASDNSTKARAFCDAIARSILAEADIGALRDELIVKPKVASARAINSDMKAARAKHRRARRNEANDDGPDLRAMLPAPRLDDELVPVLTRVDLALCNVDSPLPPMRDSTGRLVALVETTQHDLHRLTEESGDNEEEIETRMASPAHLTLAPRDVAQVQMLVSRYVRFDKKRNFTESSETYATDLPERFASAYNIWESSMLPVVRHIITAPILLRDGSVMMGDGLDRETGLLYRIDPKLREVVPDRTRVTEQDVVKALKFLVDDWLTDCQCSFSGKLVIIAYALTVICRALLPMRPMFMFEAGQRGSGKTTALSMATVAATGQEAPAAAWSPSDEERRKSLHAYLMTGISALVFDNLPRGEKVSCGALARYCTSKDGSDRVLGSSRSQVVQNATIIALTGNNIVPAGDNASRTVMVRFTSNRPDPENRPVRRPDPVGWTLDNRLEVLRALYTVAMATHVRKSSGNGLGRFVVWSDLVGSPLEQAAAMAVEAKTVLDELEAARAALEEAETYDGKAAIETAERRLRVARDEAAPWHEIVPSGVERVCFGQMLLENEEHDPEADAAADLFEALANHFGSGPEHAFTARDLADALNTKDFESFDSCGVRANVAMDTDRATLIHQTLRAATGGQFLHRMQNGVMSFNPQLLATALMRVDGRVVSSGNTVLKLKRIPKKKASGPKSLSWWVEVS